MLIFSIVRVAGPWSPTIPRDQHPNRTGRPHRHTLPCGHAHGAGAGAGGAGAGSAGVTCRPGTLPTTAFTLAINSSGVAGLMS